MSVGCGRLAEKNSVSDFFFFFVVTEAKFLDVVLDRTLSNKKKKLVNYLKTNYLKALDTLKVVNHTDLGTDLKILLCLFRSLVRS